MEDELYDWCDLNFKFKYVSNSTKYHRKDTVCRSGRLVRGELKYRGNSSMAPRKTHQGKDKTIRDHRK